MNAPKNSQYRVVVLLSGRGTNLESVYRAIQTHHWPIEIPLVISDRESAGGLVLAKNWGIPSTIIARRPKERGSTEFHRELIDAVSQANPDLILLAGYMRVLAREFVASFPGKIINIHPSLLPSFKGLHAQQQAIDAGVKFSGCTVHAVVNELDSGPILAQAVVPIFKSDTSDTLAQRILEQEHLLLPQVVGALGTGKMKIEILPDGALKIRQEEPSVESSAKLAALTSLP